MADHLSLLAAVSEAADNLVQEDRHSTLGLVMHRVVQPDGQAVSAYRSRTTATNITKAFVRQAMLRAVGVACHNTYGESHRRLLRSVTEVALTRYKERYAAELPAVRDGNRMWQLVVLEVRDDMIRAVAQHCPVIASSALKEDANGQT